jgi:hypothetical protein
MFGMSEYLMIAHEMEKARLLARKRKDAHRAKEITGTESYVRQAIKQERRNRDEPSAR